jgi:hypothetical protein
VERFAALAERWLSPGTKLVSQLNKTLVPWGVEAIGEDSGASGRRDLRDWLICIGRSTQHAGSRMPGWWDGDHGGSLSSGPETEWNEEKGGVMLRTPHPLWIRNSLAIGNR